MRRIILFASLIVLALNTRAAQIVRVEPANWWVGMKNTQLQVMVYGPNIGKTQLSFTYPGVTLKEVARTDNANYLFVYLNIAASAKPGLVKLQFNDGKQKLTYNYPLKARTKGGAAGFNDTDVLYLITPDRFANGDATNDNWDGVNVDRNDPNARHGGDLAGIEQHLDHIKDLGVTAVWLNPVQENKMPGGSYHGYAITNFYNIDPRFGTNEQFVRLTQQMHNKGLKVVMDMIFNHCGSSHPWMTDLPAKDWINNNSGKYVQTNHAKYTIMDPHAAKADRDVLVDGWFVPSMPDLNQRNRHLATYLIQNSIWWIEYSKIDGIRQDTYPYPDYAFMQRWCREVEAEYPQFNIVGESWYGRSSASAWWQKKDALNKNDAGLKTVMDFPLTFISGNAFDYDQNGGGEGSAMFRIYEEIAQDFMFADVNNVLTFLDNHDLDRFVRANDPDLRRYKQALAFLLTTRGIPQLYYGTEILMDGKKEKSDGYVRTDYPGGWKGDKKDLFTAAGRSAKQNEAYSYLQKLLQWRKANPAIAHAKLMHYLPDNSGVYVYARTAPGKTVVVFLNGTMNDQTIDTGRFKEAIRNATQGRDVITGQQVSLTKQLTIPAKGQYILELTQ
ncbi:glycoside hydrolase family 13 protein [Mucilaginibacter daejeonensis]|uniref:glycoside hydrolase family 13 protein n=1 Tax=Mucilaginibacter daejeonensis TaxID=398049 RepID=UPI001D17C2DE|nr:glycoside hydrolase family 13 protein [Mucilaginibacter daejeonensis]UEG52274.1 glycoside hydrolase family 13 protein [Mucilaginibacter daejeonensis]